MASSAYAVAWSSVIAAPCARSSLMRSTSSWVLIASVRVTQGPERFGVREAGNKRVDGSVQRRRDLGLVGGERLRRGLEAGAKVDEHENPRSSPRAESLRVGRVRQQRAHQERPDERVLVDNDSAERVIELDALGDQRAALFRLGSERMREDPRARR